MTKVVLQDELKVYQQKKQELLAKAVGKYVLIKGNEVVGVFDTDTDAVSRGYEKFGNVPFLVKQVLELEPTYNFLSNLLSV